MAKTTTLTATRSLEEIAQDFAAISDSGTLRLNQSRLVYEFVGSTEGKEAAELRQAFLKSANAALLSKKETLLSETAIVYFVNTWKYMTRANVDTDPKTNAKAGDIAKAAYVLASQTFRKKDENYVNPAIEAIVNGMDAVEAFAKATTELVKDKKAAADEAAEKRKEKEAKADKSLPFDVLIATLGLVNVENVSTYTAEQKSTLRDALKAATTLVAA
jgi:hypothetical protein